MNMVHHFAFKCSDKRSCVQQKDGCNLELGFRNFTPNFMLNEPQAFELYKVIFFVNNSINFSK